MGRADRRHRAVPAVLPAGHLVLISANTSNFGALVFPFLLIYLNSRLPKVARPRPRPRVYVVLLNFVFDQLTGEALIQF
jgi:hypothetical protein